MSNNNLSEKNNLEMESNKISLTNNLSRKRKKFEDNFHCTDYSESLLEKMQVLFESKKLCDVTLIAGADGKRINAHRFLLAASSTYFEAMFTDSLREAKEKEIKLEEVSGNILEQIIQFCYSGSIELREDNVESIFIAAHYLQFNIIVDACVDFLVRQLDHCNCLGYSLFAEQYDCGRLLEQANSYVCENYMEVCKSEDFLSLSAKRLGTLLMRDDIRVPSEEAVFNSLLSWIERDPKHRRNEIQKLLPLIRLPLLNTSFLADSVKPVCINYECQQLLVEALFYHSIPERQTTPCSFSTTKRKFYDAYLILVVDTDSNQDSVLMEIYYPIKDEWVKWDRIPQHIAKVYGCVKFQEQVFLFGVNNRNQSTIECLDLVTKQWTQFQNVRVIFPGSCVEVFQNNIFIFGGNRDEDVASNAVLRFDPNANNWSDMPTMTQRRQNFSVVVMEDYVYAIGGCCVDHYDYAYFLKSVECFDGNGWTVRCPMKHKRSHFTTAVWNKCIYVFGGTDGERKINEVERYDVDQDIWNTVFYMEESRQGLGCVLFENKFFLIGGYNNYARAVNNVEVYDPLKNSLKKMKDLMVPHYCMRAMLIPNVLT